jgi:hypothetical protein
MKISKLINYSTDICWNGQGTTTVLSWTTTTILLSLLWAKVLIIFIQDMMCNGFVEMLLVDQLDFPNWCDSKNNHFVLLLQRVSVIFWFSVIWSSPIQGHFRPMGDEVRWALASSGFPVRVEVWLSKQGLIIFAIRKERWVLLGFGSYPLNMSSLETSFFSLDICHVSSALQRV